MILYRKAVFANFVVFVEQLEEVKDDDSSIVHRKSKHGETDWMEGFADVALVPVLKRPPEADFIV